jgi:hypothetical protein
MAGKNQKDDFADMLNAMQEVTGAHPFGQSAQTAVTARGPRRGVPIRQTTKMFMCPDDLDDYDDTCNRAWAGEIEIRYEKSYETKDGDHIIVLCWFEKRASVKSDEIDADSDTEPMVKSGPLS